MSEAIFVEGLTKAYHGKTVVDHLNFSVRSGTVFGLLGANGAGKSSVIASVLYFPMLIFSGTTLPVEVMPTAMQKIISFFPLTQGLTMMKNTFLGVNAGSVLLSICVMLGVAALCTILAVRFFRWE